MTDAEEFAQIPRPPPEEPKSSQPAEPSIAKERVVLSSQRPDGDQKYTGRPSQWVTFMTGFMPMASTRDKLPPGVYRIVTTSNGNYFDPVDVVTDDLLRLPDSKSDMVVSEIEQFWTLKERFSKYGFSFKRGVLLYGPPGSGKTCTVSLIQQKIVKDGGLAVLADQHPKNVADMLQKLRQVEPERRVVVIYEDIDATIRNYSEQEVLATLDGESSISNVVFLATTNYPERLDPRVTNRPSRFDTIVKIGMPNADARRMYLEHCGVKPEDGLDGMVEGSDGFSIAHLKEVVVGVCCFGRKLKETLEKVRGMIDKPPRDDLGKPERSMGFGGKADSRD